MLAGQQQGLKHEAINRFEMYDFSFLRICPVKEITQFSLITDTQTIQLRHN